MCFMNVKDANQTAHNYVHVDMHIYYLPIWRHFLCKSICYKVILKISDGKPVCSHFGVQETHL